MSVEFESSSGYTNFGSPIANPDSEVVKAIRRTNVDARIKTTAIEKYYQLIEEEKVFQGRVRTAKSRKKDRKVFNCIFMAYNTLGIPADPHYVADLIQFSRDEIETAFNELLSPILIDPVRLARHYIDRIAITHEYRIDIEATLKKIQEIYNICLQTDPDYIKNSPAKNIAIGIIMFFLTRIQGVQLNKESLPLSFYLSWPQIRKHTDSISKIYNSSPMYG